MSASMPAASSASIAAASGALAATWSAVSPRLPLRESLLRRKPARLLIARILWQSLPTTAARSSGPLTHRAIRLLNWANRMRRCSGSAVPAMSFSTTSLSPALATFEFSTSTPSAASAISTSKVPNTQLPSGNGLLHASTPCVQPKQMSAPNRVKLYKLCRSQLRSNAPVPLAHTISPLHSFWIEAKNLAMHPPKSRFTSC
mmetsp:Transcript_13229/g.39419  ORF Transcript_13229/g.39419 Transcript_13229/m.39419 type:complete len:201 (-) Transcript_13229:1426-2028(-)